jgi:hypothetical protein
MLTVPLKLHLVPVGQPAPVNGVQASEQTLRPLPVQMPDAPRQSLSSVQGRRHTPGPSVVSQTSGASHVPFTHSSPSLPRLCAVHSPVGSNRHALLHVKGRV